MQNFYECMFIFDSNLYARDPNGVSGKVPKMVEGCGGEILVSRLWNEQRLAYPIKGHRKGTYWLTYFKMDSQRLVEFRRMCQLNEDILRNLTVKIDPRLIETVVEHAKGGRVVTPPQAVAVLTAAVNGIDDVVGAFDELEVEKGSADKD